MLIEEFLKHREKTQEEHIIVPIDEFIAVVSEKTGWTREVLNTKDIGDIEEKLKIKARKPNNLKTIKRGKSRSTLYRFVDQEKRKRDRDFITKILNE